jgi:hypothetical protein
LTRPEKEPPISLVKLYAGRDSFDAHHVCAFLEGQGIPATVMGDMLTVARGDLPLTVETLPAVWINEEDTPRAMAAMRVYLRKPGDPGGPPAPEPWTCLKCGEVIEGQFTSCWHCGAVREDQEGDADEVEES